LFFTLFLVSNEQFFSCEFTVFDLVMQVTLFVIHCGACFLYSIAAHYPDPSKTFMALTDENWKESPIAVRYNTAMYWSITTFSTTGYGDIHGVNSREMTFILFYMVFNLGLSAYIIGNMTNLVVHVTGRTRKFVSSMYRYC